MKARVINIIQKYFIARSIKRKYGKIEKQEKNIKEKYNQSVKKKLSKVQANVEVDKTPNINLDGEKLKGRVKKLFMKNCQ